LDPGDFDAIVSAVREFVNREVIPREDEIEETDAIPELLRSEAAKMGLFGYALPERYGGLGFDMEEEVRLCFEVGRTSPAFRSLFGTNNGIAGQTIANYGTEEQKQRYLPALASGEAVGCFALTEAEAGSDPSGLRTRAKRDGEEYLINGSKRFITNAELATVFVVFARTDPDAAEIPLVPAASGSTPARRGSRWARTTGRWGSRGRGPRRSSSTTSGCRPRR